MAMGSPFGALAPSHFVNHTAAGTISNALQLPVRPAKHPIFWCSATAYTLLNRFPRDGLLSRGC